MHKTAWYYNPELEKDEEVGILEKHFRESSLPDKFHSVKVKFLERNVETIIDCRELKLKYNQI